MIDKYVVKSTRVLYLKKILTFPLSLFLQYFLVAAVLDNNNEFDWAELHETK